MPKILRIINRFNLGGPTYNAVNLTRDLSPEFETMLVGGTHAPGEESSLFIAENAGLDPLIIGEMSREVNPLKDWSAYKKICDLIKRFRPDIVHTHASKAGLLGRMAAQACKTLVVVHTFHGHVFHSYFNPAKTAFFKQIERYLASKSSAIVAISEIQKKELSVDHRICQPEKIRVIPLGLDLERFMTGQEEKRNRFRKMDFPQTNSRKFYPSHI